MTQCIFSLRGAVDGDVVKLGGLMLFSPDPVAQGQLIEFEANLSTGLLHSYTPVFMATFEGAGVVSRI